jgi:hypothetical protein
VTRNTIQRRKYAIVLKLLSEFFFFAKNCGVPNFFSPPADGLINQDHVRDSRASAPLKEADQEGIPDDGELGS